MIDPEKLRRIRQSSGIPAWELIKRLDSQNLNYVFRVERGEREPTYRTIKRFAEALDVPPGSLIRDDVLNELSLNDNPGVAEAREDYKVGLFTIPIVGYVSAGQASVPEYTDGDMPAGEGVLGKIDLKVETGAGCYAVKIAGDSMLPRFLDGYIVICSPEAQWRHGDTCLVRHLDGRVWVKRMVDHEGTWCLEPDNPLYESIHLRRDEIAYAHKVVLALIK